MNRRRFFQYTIGLAATAALPSLVGEFQALNSVWVPTQTEVDEWLTYYKLIVGHRAKSFADVVLNVFFSELEQWDVQLMQLFREAQGAFSQLEGDRAKVGFAQALGYEAGRAGQSRFNANLTSPSNESLAWYNGWSTGNVDYCWKRAQVSLPRSFC